MNLANLKNERGSKRRKRVGRGDSSGLGRTCGRGEKGQKSRSGSKIRPYFEGGQIPLFRRLPHVKGFKSRNHKDWTIINTGMLEKYFKDGDTIDESILREKKLINKVKFGLKILASEELKKKLIVKADAFSKSSKLQIESAGGTCIVVEKILKEKE